MKKYDAMLVLGLKLKADGSPEQILLDRVRMAAELMRKENVPLVMPCGGQTENTPISEAEVMKRELMHLHVPENRILMEAQSLYTVENIRNAGTLLKNRGIMKPHVLLITSDYHLFRAAYMARTMGFRVKGIGCKTPKDALKKQRKKLEIFYFINYITGWETGKRKRPSWYDCAVERIQKRKSSEDLCKKEE